ncbi:MAG TPA: PQQ-binding-like beta-propeller repeat protein [Phycisphaerales bacterium]|nr:PQQ-binding-like beta-propeller repeat protein [Phycisphaerales bacterium]HMP35977.1 PQQ-binding-like beta-propeller repeat protein [Phycisphaerales bacterium]
MSVRFALFALLAPALLVHAPASADWSNIGGDAGRSGRGAGIGPGAPELRWQGGPNSIIAWHPSIEGDRVFVIRQTSFVPDGVPDDARVYCLSLVDGSIRWQATIPFEAGDWTPVLYGVSHGRVFAGRGGNGSSSSAPVHCFDAATGSPLWISAAEVATGSYDGVVFSPEGDPIFATNTYLRRVSALDGSTLWNSVRNCSVSGDCGPAIANGSIYIDEVAAGGQVITRFDLASGARLYSSPVMPGFLSQNTPMADGDGGIYYPRTQGNQLVDFFYAFTDTGAAFVQRWAVPCIAGAGSQHAIGVDGSVYLLGPDGRLQRREPLSGALVAESDVVVTAAITQSHFAVDAAGSVFYGNGGFPGAIYAFSPDLALAWSVPVPALNQGGPSLAADGTLVVCGNGTVIRAYRTEPACAFADLSCDGSVDGADLGLLLGAWGGGGAADLDGSGSVDGADLGLLLGAWQ